MLDQRDLIYVINAHTENIRDSGSTTRKWDGKTPYHVHPIWGATTILHETSLPEDTRVDGSQAFLYHDVPEDTTVELPLWLSDRVKGLIFGMTFDSSEDEWENLWNRDKEIRLLKVYDKTSNMLDSVWMEPERREKHKAHLARLINDAYQNYGDLNIIKIAEVLV